MSEFRDRVVLVTGATGGLGTAVSDAFLSRGAVVVGASRSGEPRQTVDNYVALAADLTSSEGAQTTVAQTIEKAGRLDGLVHLVGGFAGGKSVAETDDATWDNMIHLNLRSAFLVMRAALRHMNDTGYGRIVGVGSRTAVEPEPNLGAYGLSKAGLNALVKTIAKETRDADITANVVLASTIDTPANRKSMPDADFSKWVTPAAIAQQIVWLCSDASADVSGALIPIYGRS